MGNIVTSSVPGTFISVSTNTYKRLSYWKPVNHKEHNEEAIPNHKTSLNLQNPHHKKFNPCQIEKKSVNKYQKERKPLENRANMASMAVSFLIIKLSELLEHEAQLLAGVEPDVQYIRDELEFMKAFLRDVDTKTENDDLLKAWVSQVRDLAHDMEDALDYFRLRLLRNHGRGFFAYLQSSSYFIRSLRARRGISCRMRSIKSRVIAISEGHRRYCIRNDNMIQHSSSRANGVARFDNQGDALFLEEADLVGIEKPKKELMGCLFGGKADREVVAVVGFGGLGKTTLARKVYDDAEVKMQFKFRAWITVSQSSKTEELLKDIINQLFHAQKKRAPKEVKSMKTDQLKEWINEFLRQKRYLIVLDDLWHVDTWDAVKHAFPNNKLGGRVLLTTRNTEVASTSCVDSLSNVYPLHPLSPEESWTLFCKKIFQQDSCPQHLKEVAESILRRCEGLPLAIVAISGVLASKEKNRVQEWELIQRSLGAELEDNDKLKNMTKILSLSYNDLPYYLKSCLLYFSIFPEDQMVEHMRLIRLWIAEGFVKGKDGKTLEEVAESYLKELLNRSLIQVADSTTEGRIKTCRVHDLLREIITSISKEENFAAIAKDKKAVWPEKARRLSARNSSPSIPPSHGKPRLRSLLMFWGLDSLSQSPICKIPSNGLKLLNVLDLQGAPLEDFPAEIFNLTLLKYLSLKKTKVKHIPSSIGKLQELETLDLKGTQVMELPIEILTLQKLRHLAVYRYVFEDDPFMHTKYGCNVPLKIGDLHSLQKLCFVAADHGGKALMEEIGKLIQLRRLGIIKLRTSDWKILCSSIEKLINLRALSVTSIAKTEILDMQYISSPPRLLQRLYLTGCLVALPDWIPSLHSLEKVVLQWSRLSIDPLPSLQYLPNLVHVELVQVYNGELLQFQAAGFQKLKFLGLNKMGNLKSIVIEKGAMPLLEELIVQCCKLLRKVPTGLEHLTKLKVFQLVDMDNELINSMRPDGEGEDFKKVAHVLEVSCTSQINGNWDVLSVENIKDGENCNRVDSFTKRPREHHVWK